MVKSGLEPEHPAQTCPVGEVLTDQSDQLAKSQTVKIKLRINYLVNSLANQSFVLIKSILRTFTSGI